LISADAGLWRGRAGFEDACTGWPKSSGYCVSAAQQARSISSEPDYGRGGISEVPSQQGDLLVLWKRPGRKQAREEAFPAGAAAHGVLQSKQPGNIPEPEPGGPHF
jgi:hypothetical protein